MCPVDLTMRFTTLSVGSEEFEKVASYITKSYPNSCIMFIEKIENHRYEEKYETLKASMENPDERILFHGTTERSAYAIAEDGYRISMNKRSQYGVGTYFAGAALYSKDYADIHKNDEFELSFMLVNKVLTGRKVQGRVGSKINLESADSQVDSVTSPRLFSIPREYQAIPLYLVAFHKNA